MSSRAATPSLPAPGLAGLLSSWLAGPRGRALRRAQIGLRRRVLEVGCGHGVVTEELRRRAAGTVVTLDPAPASAVVAGRAEALPFPAASFDLVFFQNVLLWVSSVESALQEAARVLEPGGQVVALEPDYGGLLEYPDLGLGEVWQAGLSRAGATPCVGRELPARCAAAGLEVWVELAHLPRAATAATVSLLEGLPLTAEEQARVEGARRRLENQRTPWEVFLHVPYFILVAGRPRLADRHL